MYFIEKRKEIKTSDTASNIITSPNKPSKKRLVQKSKDNLDDIIKVDDLELREKWLEQEKEAIELLKEEEFNLIKIALFFFLVISLIFFWLRI